MAAPEGRRVWIVPTRRDPRWFILAYLFAFVLYALNSPGFSRRPEQFLLGLVVCLSLDWALPYCRAGLLLAPLSGLVTSTGVLLLTDSPSVWPYGVVAALSSLSKHLIRVEGRHVFNPNNFGIVVALLFLSDDVTVQAGRWGGSMAGWTAVGLLGVIVAWRGRRLDLAAAYAGTFFVGVLLRCAWLHKPFLMVAAPMTGAAFQLFTFFMITDPMTTPQTRTGRVAFGVVLAALDTALRIAQVRNSPFYALFIMTSLMPFLRQVFVPKTPEVVWRIRRVPLGSGR